MELTEFLTLTNMLLIGSGLAFGAILMFFLAPYLQGGSKVFYLRERDRRGSELRVQREDNIKVVTKGKMPMRFYKYRGAYEFIKGGFKKVTVFLGKEGTAYNYALEGFEETTIEVKEKLSEWMKLLWGDAFWMTIPEDRRQQCDEKTIRLTVALEKGMTPEGFAPITEKDINNDGDEAMAAVWAKGVNKGAATPIINYLLAIGAGAGVTFAVCLAMGWIQLAKIAAGK